MNFTDVFVRRPVLATVVSTMILVLGLRSAMTLPILQYPRTQNAVVTVSTQYFGADPETVAGFVTTPLENAIAQANGIDYLTSTSQIGTSTITANLRLNYDSGKALTEISTKISSVINQLPNNVQRPVITVKVGQTIDAMYLGFGSDILTPSQVTDYLIRVVQPRLQSVPGVQTAELIGGKTFALRAWLDPIKLAAYGVTATELSAALSGNDYIAGLGSTKGQMVQVNLTAATSLHSLEEFRNLVVKQAAGANVKLRDVATVTLGSDDYDSSVSFNGKQAVYIGIQVAPAANLLDVVKGVKTIFPEIKAALPAGLISEIVYDSTDFVTSSINEVAHTLLEALLIVTAVVFMFLGSWRSALIPVIAIPLSLIGVFTVLLALGFSINLLTLLALVLAIGLVVDDAIIVVENVNRHLAEGLTPFNAATLAARELAGPIIAMTIVLIAVYVPIGFQGGLTGALFIEFAFTLAGAVTVSAIVALTLSPVSCAFILKAPSPGRRTIEDRIVHFIDARMNGVRERYLRWLDASLHYVPVTFTFGFLVLSSIYWLYSSSKSELAPNEDQGIILTQSTPAPNATLQQKLLYAAQAYTIFARHPETQSVFQINSPGANISGMVLTPADQRTVGAESLQNTIQQELSVVAGLRIVAFQPPPLPGSTGLPIQFVVQTTDSFDKLNVISRELMGEALKTGQYMFLDTDLKIDQPQTSLIIDREKAAQLGLKMNDIGGALTTALSGGYTHYFGLDGRSYKVIPQIGQRFRLNADQILNYYIKTAEGASVPLSTVAKIETATVPESLNHFYAQRQAGQTAAALQDANDALAIAAADPAAHLQALLLALDRNQVAQAKPHLAFLTGHLDDPGLEELLKGRVMFADGRFEEACATLQHAFELDPRRTDALLLAGAAAARAKQEVKAYELVLRRVVAADPGRSGSRPVMTRFYLSTADVLQPAVGAFAALSTGNEDPNPELCEGLVRYFLKDFPEADRRLSKVVTIDAANSQAYSYRSLIALQRNDRAAALKWAGHAMESDRQYAIAHFVFGAAQEAQGKNEAAVKAQREALALDPKLLGARVKLGELLRVREPGEAKKLLLVVVGMDGTYPGAKRALYQLDK